jgi:hypothetical protein
VSRRPARTEPTPNAEPPEDQDAGDAEVVPLSRERKSRDFSQRAFDVVREATEGHDDEDDEDE